MNNYFQHIKVLLKRLLIDIQTLPGLTTLEGLRRLNLPAYEVPGSVGFVTTFGLSL